MSRQSRRFRAHVEVDWSLRDAVTAMSCTSGNWSPRSEGPEAPADSAVGASASPISPDAPNIRSLVHRGSGLVNHQGAAGGCLRRNPS